MPRGLGLSINFQSLLELRQAYSWYFVKLKWSCFRCGGCELVSRRNGDVILKSANHISTRISLVLKQPPQCLTQICEQDAANVLLPSPDLGGPRYIACEASCTSDGGIQFTVIRQIQIVLY